MGWRQARSRDRRHGRPSRLHAPEALESRQAFSISPVALPGAAFEPAWLGSAVSTALRGAALPMASPGPTGFTPAQIRQAYGLDQISFGGTPADGRGTTIAIVTAYDSPNIAADLATFNATFGIPAPPSFQKVNQTGGSTLPVFNPSWSTETCLDVQWAHAIAPGASILLVEAKSNATADMLAAVRYARSAPGVVAVSMSWGQAEYAGETVDDVTFTTPAGHPPVSFFAASGDRGAPGIYPAMSPNVVAIGGTSLRLGKGGVAIESAWGRSGGGVSAYQARPAYQAGIVTQTTKKRATPDVALVSDPATGLAVCDSKANGAKTPWVAYGGTSIATPQWAAIGAIVAQGRALRGAAPLDGRKELLPALYALPAADFRDIVSGSSNGSPRLAAGPGYDLVTGRGTPIAAALVRDLVAWGSAAGPSSPAAPGAPAAPTSLTVAVTSSTATLTWGAVSGAVGYRLYETTGGTVTLIASYDAATTSATLAGLSPRSTHTWRLEAWNSAGSAAATAQATLAAGATTPTGITIKVVSATTIDLSWQGVGGATSYSVFLWAGRAARKVAGVTAPTTTVRIAGLASGSTIRVAVRAENSQGNATSEWVSFQLPG